MIEIVCKRGMFIVAICALAFVISCRGFRKKEQPVHFNPNLDQQFYIKPQRMPLLPPEGTVAFGNQPFDLAHPNRAMYLRDDDRYYLGFTLSPDTQWVQRVPAQVTRAMVERGRERFNIYCAVCHDRAGTGKGPVIEKGFAPPPVFNDPRLLALTDGQFYNIITNGVRTMPSYAKQIPVDDRWAIVTYIRALQMNLEGMKQP